MSRSLKILLVVPILGCGGAEILLGDIALELTERGHNVSIVCLFPYHESWWHYPRRSELEQKVSILIIESSVKFKILGKTVVDNALYVDFVEKIKPDIIHSHLYLAELVTYSYIKSDVKYFSHGHDNMRQLKKPNVFSIFSRKAVSMLWERTWLVNQYRRANNSFIAISSDVFEYLNNNVRAYVKNIHYIPNAINISRFAFKRSYNSISAPFRIVSIGNLVPKKNHAFLIDVAFTLKNRGINVLFEVFGHGHLLDELNAKVRSLNLDECFIFHGSVGDIPQRLRDAHLYVHPAWYEPFGLVLLEAMASGLPVVSLDGFGNRELMKEGQNGFMLPQDSSAEEFADKIQYFIEKPEERERQGQWAAAFALEYDIERYVDRLLSLYKQP